MFTPLQIGLSSVATMIFTWATSVYNGGLLNDIFMVSPNLSITLKRSDFLQTLHEAVVQNLFRGGRQNLEVYRWLPTELRDGDGASQRIAILTGVTILFAFFLLLLPLAVVIVTSNCRCCRKGPKNSGVGPPPRMISRTAPVYGKAVTHEARHLEKLNERSHSERSADRFRIYHIAVFTITFLFLLAMMVTMCFLFLTADHITDLMVEDSSASNSTTSDATSFNFNFLDVFDFVFKQAIDFLESGVAAGNASSPGFLNSVNITLMTLLENRVSIAVDDLLKRYGVQLLIRTGEYLQSDLDILRTNMNVIRLNNQKVSADISNLVGQFKVIYDLVVPELTNTCSINLGPEIGSLCASLRNRVSILLLQFNPSAIKVDPPVVLNFIFNELGLDLTAILDQFGQFTTKISEMKSKMVVTVSSLMDLNSFLASITQVWSIVDNETNSLRVSFAQGSKQMTEGMERVRRWINAVIYTITAILLCILIAYIVIAFLYVQEASKTQVFYIDKNDFIDSSKVCSGLGTRLHAIFFMVFFIAISIFIIIFLPTCVLLASDGCAYLTNQRGVAQSDYVLNSFIATELWPKLVAQVKASIGSPGSEFVVLPSPRDIINTITVLCRPTTNASRPGFLRAIGWTSVIDMTALMNSKEMTDSINKGENLVKDEIVKQDFANLIPKNLDQVVETAQNLTQYFDGINYQPSIDELAPDRLPSAHLAAYADDLESLNGKLHQLGLSPNAILQKCVALIRTSLKEITVVEVESKILRDAFVAVQTRRNLSTGIAYLVQGITATEQIFNNQTALLTPVSPVYWQFVDAFKGDIKLNLTSAIEAFVHDLFPCSQLYSASDALLTFFCRQNGAVSRLFTWIWNLSLSMAITTLLFFSLFHLGCVQSQHFRRLRQNSHPLSASYVSSKDRYAPMPTDSQVAPPMARIYSLPYRQPRSGQQVKERNIGADDFSLPPYDYTYSQEPDWGGRVAPNLNSDQDHQANEAETVYSEIPRYQPVPLPRSGNRYLPTKAEENAEEMTPEEKVEEASEGPTETKEETQMEEKEEEEAKTETEAEVGREAEIERGDFPPRFVDHDI